MKVDILHAGDILAQMWGP